MILDIVRALGILALVLAIGLALVGGAVAVAHQSGGLALLLVAPLVFAVIGVFWLFADRSGTIEGRRYAVSGRTVEVAMPVANPAILGRRELEEIAAGKASPRTGNFAVKPEFRDAVKTLLASGSETVLFLEPDLVRFEGYERGSVKEVVRALIRLAGPGFVLARHAGTGVCPYCKESVSDGRRCETCGSEHHAACYEEHGGCAIFGCERAPSGRRAREK